MRFFDNPESTSNNETFNSANPKRTLLYWGEGFYEMYRKGIKDFSSYEIIHKGQEKQGP